MAANRTDAAKSGTEPAAGAAPAAAPAQGSALQTWLPVIVSVVLMPVLAYVTTTFLLVPKLLQATGQPKAHAAASAEHGGDAKSEGKSEHNEHGEGKEGADGKGRNTAPLEKVLVNIAGSMGTRYLLVKMTLVSDEANLKGKVEKNSDQLRDLASSALSNKTISDLEKPGSRNQIRSELISAFNSALGSGTIREIYFTEFAIQ